jgi:hypothetical protein
MLPPVLEIIVVWHPKDREAAALANMLFEHFHGTAFSGLIGGAIEVYVRSAGWCADAGAPRPLPNASFNHPAGVANPHVVAVVPLLGIELAAEVEPEGSAWREYMSLIQAAAKQDPTRFGVFPHALDPGALDGTVLGQLLGRFQRLVASPPKDGDTLDTLLSRELAQGVAQLLTDRPDGRLTVFISHTKRHSQGEGGSVAALIDEVRAVIKSTRLAEFFDATDLQPGQDWDSDLRIGAATSALLAIRTDLYPSREWCQREMLIAKREGMPVVILDAIGAGEERGSFLMDHVPRTSVRLKDGKWDRADIYRALDVMVDQCLKRELWRLQEQLTHGSLGLTVAWWAPHAPEPITLLKWLNEQKPPAEGDDLVIIHPDPPLGADERKVLQEMMLLSGSKRTLVVMTPRLLAARSA